VSARTIVENQTRWLWLGVVDSTTGDVVARRIDYFDWSRKYGETPTHGGALKKSWGWRWRYPEGSNTVFWWESPDREARVKVDDFLAKQGVLGLRHRTMTDMSKEDDISAGHLPLPLRYRLRQEAATTSGYAWLTPDGKFFDVAKTHGNEAARLLGVPPASAIATAFTRGWARIVHSGTDLLAHRGGGGRLTDAQQRALVRAAHDLGKERIVLDNDNSYHVIWSVDEM